MAQHHSTQLQSSLFEVLVRRVANLPPVLSIPEISKEFLQPADTTRKQIRRGTFPLRVQVLGGQKVVTLGDYIRYLETGEIQSQQLTRPVGRPKNKARAALNKGGANV